MTIKNMKIQFAVCMLALVSVILGAAHLAQAQDGPRRRGPGDGPQPFGAIKRALEEAGAPALSADQESQLAEIARAFHESLPKPDESLRDAHAALDNAVLAGDTGAAQAAANALAGLQSSQLSARLSAEAAARIQVLNVLKANDAQVTALVQRFGNEGLARLLGSVFGGPAGPRRVGPGLGPGGPGFGAGPRPRQ